MEPRFIEPPMDPSQQVLFARTVDECVAPGDPVRLVADFLDALDYGSLRSSYGHMGRPAYDPELMYKLLYFAYKAGVTSSRRIAELAGNDVRVMWLVKGYEPDFHTIARFRKEKASYFRSLFEQSARLCAEWGLVRLGVVSVDGTKLLANASKKSLKKREQVERMLEEFDRLNERGVAEDAEEDALYGDGEGPELPEELRDPKGRKEKLRQLRERLTKSCVDRFSTTDPDALVMKTSRGLSPGYNGQMAVDAEGQVIVGAHLTTNQNDHGELGKVLDDVERTVGVRPDVVLADGGYPDEATLKELDSRGQDALMPVQESSHKDERNEWFQKRCFVYDAERDVYVCPMGEVLERRKETRKGCGTYVAYWRVGCYQCEFHGECVGGGPGNRKVERSVAEWLRDAMRERMSDPMLAAVYERRWWTSEPVFGQMKGNQGMERLRTRGLAGAEGEFLLACTVLNGGRWVKARMPLWRDAVLGSLAALLSAAARWLTGGRRPTTRATWRHPVPLVQTSRLAPMAS